MRVVDFAQDPTTRIVLGDQGPRNLVSHLVLHLRDQELICHITSTAAAKGKGWTPRDAMNVAKQVAG
jgi:hypothetical protein